MKENYSVVALIVDRSGSMQGVEDDTIGGVNAFIEKQRAAEGIVSFILVQFDDVIEVIHDFKDIREVPHLNSEIYYPRGMTSLLDAIGITTKKIEKRIHSMEKEERPSNVIIAIITDGCENNSTEYNIKQIRNMIRELEKEKNWDFNFISADLNAVNEASNLGFQSGKIASYRKSRSASTFEAMAEKVVRSRKGGNSNFSQKELNSMMEEDS